ncbi:MAG: hypothetical protein AAF567_07485 [Actinomycetota bacterium]
MPMRQDCKFFESRTYATGDTVRKCDLDLAPEAPWRCPENCEAYTRRMADVNWAHGSLVTPPTPDEPDSLGDDESIAALLDAAEEIVRSAGPDVLADLEQERAKRSKKRFGLKKSGGQSGSGKKSGGGARGRLGNLGQYLRDQRKKGQ